MTHSQRKPRGNADIPVYGRRAVVEALASPYVEVERVLISRRVPQSFRRDLIAACRGAPGGEVPFEQVYDREVHAISHDSRNDQGVVAEARLGLVTEAEDFVESLAGPGGREPAHVLGLDNVSNPQNVGMIVRTAVALGIRAVLWPSEGVPWVSGLVIKASAGVVFRCPIIRCESLVEGIGALQAGGFWVTALAGESSVTLDAHEPRHRQLYLLGSEAEGLTDETLSMCDERVRIEMSGGVESLNVAVAAGVLCAGVRARRDTTA